MSRPPAPAIWIVDDDLGFVWWLGEIFTQAGCRALPALSCAEAAALMKKLGIEPDLIVLNLDLPGIADLLHYVQRTRRHVKIVGIGPPPFGVPVRVHATLERPSGIEPVSRLDWLKRVRKLLKSAEIAAAV